MIIITGLLNTCELKEMAAGIFGDMVKAVVDVENELVAVNAELHSDLEALLLEKGSKQKNLWGINIYPGIQGDEWIEFDSMINMKPSQGNKSRGVDSEDLRRKILGIIKKRIGR